MTGDDRCYPITDEGGAHGCQGHALHGISHLAVVSAACALHRLSAHDILRCRILPGKIVPMPLPAFDVVISPLFELLARSPAGLKRGDAVRKLADEFSLTDEERNACLPGSGKLAFMNVVDWAHGKLKWAGLSAAPSRGLWQLTPDGRARHTAGSPDSIRTRRARAWQNRYSIGSSGRLRSTSSRGSAAGDAGGSHPGCGE